MKTDVKELLAKLRDTQGEGVVEIVNSKDEVATFESVALIPIAIPDDDDEESILCHNFAFLQPKDESGESVGEVVIFDIVEDEDGECSIDVVTDQYLITELYDELRKLRRSGNDDEEPVIMNDEVEEESIEDEKTEEKHETIEKKGFFGRLFGKK